MKSFNTIIKNLKLLIRSKSSALVVLLAPLLIVLIIGIGFADFDEGGLTVGVHVSEPGELVDRFVDNLESNGNTLVYYDSSSSCVRGIQEGVILACISFPEGFSIGNERSELTFFIDESRINLVYRLISSLSSSVGSEQVEISQEITGSLLELIDRSADGFTQTISDIVSLRARANSISSNVNRASSDVGGLDISVSNFNFNPLRSGLSALDEDFSNLRVRALDIVDSGEVLINNTVEGTGGRSDFISDLNALKSSLSNTESTAENFEEFEELLENLISSFGELRSQLQAAANVKSDVQSSLNAVSSGISNLDSDLDQIKVRQENLLESINRLEFRSAETIAQPFTTNIEPVTASLGRLTYSFPYLLMLVIMFIGIMLSSTLVFMEKDSKAFFRNFTTPTRKIFFSSMTYFTSMIIILAQVFVILLVAYFYLDIPMLLNWQVSLVIILLSSTLFVLLGMLIGNFFNTNEAITMSNIAIGSVFMFLSNLILPLETLSDFIRSIAAYNPFVVSAEAMRGALLFEFDFVSLMSSIIYLVSVSLTLFILILLFQNVSGSSYLHKLKNRNKKIVLPEDSYLKLEDKNVVIKNVKDLYEFIKNLSDEEYLVYTRPENIFSQWLEKSLKQRFLAYRIKKKKKSKVVKILEKQLKKKKNKDL